MRDNVSSGSRNRTAPDCNGTSVLKFGARLTAGLCAAGVAGCVSTIGSSYDTKGSATGPISGVPYSLPKVMLEVALVRDADGISVEISEPIYVGDPKATYVLKYMRRGSSKDTFNVSVDPRSTLLVSVGGEAEDQTAQAIVAIAQAVGGVVKPEAAVTSPSRQVFYQSTFDPARDTGRVNTDLAAALEQEVKAAITGDCVTANRAADRAAGAVGHKSKTAGAPEVIPETNASCRLSDKWPAGVFSISVDYKAFAYEGGVVAAPCTEGICTRMVHPAILSVRAGEREISSQIFSMPNDSAAVAVPLSRATFVKSTHAITLSNGLVATTQTTKDSEVLAAAKIPFDILKAVFAAPAELVQLKVNLTNTEKTLLLAEKEKLEAEKGRLEAEKQLAEARNPKDGGGTPADTNSGKQESTAVAGSAPGNTLLMKVVLPGFGKGSGAELAAAPELQNQGEEASGATGGGAHSETRPQHPADGTPDFGGPTSGGSNGTHR